MRQRIMWCCRFMFVCMYICIYVYPSHSTRDTLIAQLLAAIALFLAVCRRHTRQVGSTLHHHWPQICSLYHLIAVHCVPLCLLLNCMLNGCWHHNIRAVHVHNYVDVDWTARTLVLEATSAFQNCHTRGFCTQPCRSHLQNWQSRTSAMRWHYNRSPYIHQWALPIAITSMLKDC